MDVDFALTHSRMWVKSLHYTFYENCLLFDGKLVRCMLLEMIRGYFTNFYMYFSREWRLFWDLILFQCIYCVQCSHWAIMEWAIDWREWEDLCKLWWLEKLMYECMWGFAKSFTKSLRGNRRKILLFHKSPIDWNTMQTMIWNKLSRVFLLNFN